MEQIDASSRSNERSYQPLWKLMSSLATGYFKILNATLETKYILSFIQIDT